MNKSQNAEDIGINEGIQETVLSEFADESEAAVIGDSIEIDAGANDSEEVNVLLLTY